MAERFVVKEYRYGVMGSIRSGCALPIALAGLVVLVTIARDAGVFQSVWATLLLAGMGLLYLAFGLSAAIIFPPVAIVDGGLELEILWLWWLFVPWEDVLDLYQRKGRVGQMVVVAAEGLTPIHLLYGLVYGTQFRRAFLIWSDIKGYDDLVETIVLRTGKRLRM